MQIGTDRKMPTNKSIKYSGIGVAIGKFGTSEDSKHHDEDMKTLQQ